VLSPLELVPILSYLALRGRCSACGSRISRQYPLVEFLSGFSFVFVYVRFIESQRILSAATALELALILIAVSLLIAILVYDIRHKIIPPKLVIPLIALSVIIALARFYNAFWGEWTMPLLFDLFAGPMFYLFFYVLWRASRGRWLGLGDGNLSLALGFLLGFEAGLSALILAFWIGAALGLALLAYSRMLPKVLPAFRFRHGSEAITMKSEIPFAPFLILGAALVYFFHISVFSFF
jgi:prepilin signal peptidase PulO-like enzyme (type II secretory pathway)